MQQRFIAPLLVLSAAATLMAGGMGAHCTMPCTADTAAPVAATPADSTRTELAVQTLCPIMQEPINKKQFVDYNGQRIYVCCPMCVGKVKKNPEEAIAKLAALGQKPATVPTGK